MSSDDFEREKWQAEIELKRREFELKEREQSRLEGEQELRRAEQAKSLWSSPLTVAVFAAAVAGAGNAVVAFVNGQLQRQLEIEKSRAEIGLERTKAESSRILEMIKTGDEDKAAANLNFLLKSGLVVDPVLEPKLNTFLANRTPGSGPALPSPTGRIGFEQTSELTRPILEGLQNVFDKYFDYLDKIGFPPAKQQVKVRIKTLGSPQAYYSPNDNVIAVDRSLADDPSVALREYNLHVLQSPNTREKEGPFGALE